MNRKLREQLLSKLINWKRVLEDDIYYSIDIIFNIYNENKIDLDIYLDRSDIKSNIFFITKLDSLEEWYVNELETNILDKVERKLDEAKVCV